KGRAAAKVQMERFIAHQSVPMPVFQDVLAVFDDPKAASAKLRAAFTDPANHDQTRQLKIAFWASFFGDTELANKALHVFAIDLNGERLRVLWHPVFAPARKTRGFKDLMRSLGLYEYWRTSGKWSDFCHPVGADDFECH
ncbi:MAG TPA: hypothetical protein VEH07_07705, partial [Alphaproteobacteria bacterium]|nr:hypothetical protein [Alphaproteobacteria bacterium]